MSIGTVLWFASMLAVVVALILGLAWIARRSGFAGIAPKPIGRKRRLAIVEAMALDPKRRLVIVRRDGVEHLLLLGHAGETVVERGFAPPEAFSLPKSERA